MRKWIHALTLMLALSAAFPSTASTIGIADANGPFASLPAVITPITGADGPLAPAADYALPYRAAGIFDFSAIDLGTGITLRFDSQMQRMKLFSLGNIMIAGVIDASGIDLALETPGQGLITSSISADTFSLMANTLSMFGTITAPADVMLPGSGLTPHGPGTISLALPEPATSWLVVALLPMLALFGPKRARHG